MSFPILLLDTQTNTKSPFTTTCTYNEPHHVITKVIHKEPKDNPSIIDFTGDNQFDTRILDSVEPVSPIPSVSSASIGESRPLSPLSSLEEDDHWCNGFLNLVSSLTLHSEGLETLSVEFLQMEGRMRQLKALEKTLMEQYEREEAIYLERLEECKVAAERQSKLIQSLAELDRDVVNKATRHVYLEQGQKRNTNQFNSMEDKIHSLRCEIGLFFGGSVGTSRIVHAFESPEDGFEYIIAGSGTTVSQSIQHLSFRKHEYMLHINQRDRKTKFRLLPQKYWTPDSATNQCQFQSCSLRFSFFNRRHHCRRCGILVCQKHSLNRLPLFSPLTKDAWHRICDGCFRDLIIVKNPKDSATQLSNMC